MRKSILVAVVCGLLLRCSSMAPDYYTERVAEIRIDLEAAAREAIQAANASVDPSADSDLALIWDQAAKRLAQDNASSSDVAAAERNVKLFVETAIRSGGAPSGMIAPRNVQTAKFSLCPLYPICK